MKFSTALATLVVAAAMTFQSASAQSPDQMFGLGVSAGSSAAIELCYAVNPAIHIGAGVGITLHSHSVNNTSTSSNYIVFAPYARFILKGTSTFKPFLQGAFEVASGPVQTGLSTENQTNTGLGLGGGAFYFPAATVGLFGQISVISLGFGDVSTTDIGIHSGRLGALWFFN